MTGELRRGAIRIGANYGRLLLNVLIGLVLVRVAAGGLGYEAWGLYSLLGATMGFAQMFREVVRYSMNRELGAAFHDPDPDVFPRVFNSAQVLSGLLALVAGGIFVLLLLLIEYLNIPPDLLDAARWVIVAHGIYTSGMVLMAPQFNMFVVSERMILSNLWLFVERLSYLIAAVYLFLIPPIVDDPARGLILFSVISSALAAVSLAGAVGTIIALDPRLKPRLSLARRADVMAILSTSGWNSVVVVAINMHMRLDQLLMNVFGVMANSFFGFGMQLASYARMITVGMTDGLDAVAARMGATREAGALQGLLTQTTRLHALVALPAGAAVIILADPLVALWLGGTRRIDPTYFPIIASIIRILVIGTTARAIADGWTRLLYGAGHVRRVAPLVLIGGLLNPLLALVLILVLPTYTQGPQLSAIHGPSLAFAGAFTLMHFIALPRVVARTMQVPYRDVMAPILRPAVCTAISAGVLIVADRLLVSWGLWRLPIDAAIYGTVYAGCALVLVLSPEERRLGVRALRQARARLSRA